MSAEKCDCCDQPKLSRSQIRNIRASMRGLIMRAAFMGVMAIICASLGCYKLACFNMVVFLWSWFGHYRAERHLAKYA